MLMNIIDSIALVNKTDSAVWVITLTLILLEALNDLLRREIKILYLIITAGIGITALIFSGDKSEIFSSIMGIGIGLLIIVMAYLTQGGIGYGDGLLLCVTGLLIGLRGNIILLFMGCFFSAIVSMFLLVIKKADRKTPLPFVPFLIPAVITAYIFERII